MTPSPGPPSGDSRGPYSSQTVSVSWDEGDTTPGSRRFQFGVSECIETKTVTTTTTTKRTFPPLFVREPRPLDSLDVKEYPLASKPTPPQLAQFTFDVPGFDLFAEENASPKQVSVVYCGKVGNASISAFLFAVLFFSPSPRLYPSPCPLSLYRFLSPPFPPSLAGYPCIHDL